MKINVAVYFRMVSCALALGAGIAFSEDDGRVRVEYLDDSASLLQRNREFSRASKYDNREVNDKLVELLDSEEPGGLINDMILMPSWHEALNILARRFPEAGITKRPTAYQRGDARAFKEWWAKNQGRIGYGQNAHHIVGEPSPESGKAPSSVARSPIDSANPPMSLPASPSGDVKPIVLSTRMPNDQAVSAYVLLFAGIVFAAIWRVYRRSR